MLAVVLSTTYPLICTAEHLSHAPFAAAVRLFATAADNFSAAVLALSAGRKPLPMQCRQLHYFVYVRTLTSICKVRCFRKFPMLMKLWQQMEAGPSTGRSIQATNARYET